MGNDFLVNSLKIVILQCVLLAVQVQSQGQRCDQPSDCTDEYNPYCSKWGYCTWTPGFGDTGPPQSRGAVEDGTRGQCRDDNDCTPWAPSCSPLGYCRGGVQDGSFGAPTNPKKGGKQSDWIKKNARSGGARNEEYYGKIEDDNRRNHENFREKYPILFPEEVFGKDLIRLRSIEERVYEPCTYCEYDPKAAKSNGGNGGGRNTGTRNQNRKGPSNSSNKNGKRGQNRLQGNSRSSNRGGTKRNSQNNQKYHADIKAGKIPGKAGKDYPNYSLKNIGSKFKGIKNAPKDKVPKNYPQRKSGGSTRSSSNDLDYSYEENECPGSLNDCMHSCPSNKRVYKVCVKTCTARCARKRRNI